MSFIDEVKFDDKGLAVAIAQDADDGQVLMVAYMNREAVEKTLETGQVHYYSRSRQRLWLKGESSGHVQTVRDIRLDCDGDAILIAIEQAGAACHVGYRSCFYRQRTADDELEIVGEKLFDPAKVYGDE